MGPYSKNGRVSTPVSMKKPRRSGGAPRQVVGGFYCKKRRLSHRRGAVNAPLEPRPMTPPLEPLLAPPS